MVSSGRVAIIRACPSWSCFPTTFVYFVSVAQSTMDADSVVPVLLLPDTVDPVRAAETNL